ncbi:MAG: protoheme IX farnesyltransferase [Rhizobiales bacterium]|nr:protoheme IX farnesyltransferase [Hyphomicrobiales bacterium]
MNIDINAKNGNPAANELGAEQMADVKDYFELLKPSVMRLVVFTALVGLVVAPGYIHPFTAFISILCIAIGAGSAGCLNMWYEHKIDALMSRTANRPIPSGRIKPDQALTFGILLMVGSVTMLGMLVNWFAAGFLAFTIFYYMVIYTMWLKPRTPLNIVIGGASGAFPPMIGYACVTGSITIESLVLFLIIFMWTPAHFWALNLYIKRDYEKANIPMMPSVKGEPATRRQILAYTYITAICGLLPALLGFAGLLYASAALVLGFGFIYFAHQVHRHNSGDAATKAAKNMFAFSLLYLMLLFTLLLAEHSFDILVSFNLLNLIGL